jgi:hypothetical protein
MDPLWKNFYEWWLERADWNLTEFFPNITRFDSLEELREEPKPFNPKTIYERNLKIQELWKNCLSKYADTL